MSRLDHTVGGKTDPGQNFAPESFDDAQPFGWAGIVGNRLGDGVFGKVLKKGARKGEGFLDFQKPDKDTCGHVPCMGKSQGGGKAPVGVSSVVGPEIPCLGAGPADDPSETKPVGDFRKKHSRILEPVLKSPMVIINFVEGQDLFQKNPVFLEKIRDGLII